MKKQIILLTGISWLSWTALGWGSNAGTTGAILLKQNFSPRVESVAESYVALADDVYSMYYNPAGLARMLRPQVTTGFNTGAYDDRSGLIAGAMPLTEKFTLGLGLAYYHGGMLELTDLEDTYSRTVIAESDYLFSAAAAYPLDNHWLVGVTAKALISTLVEDAHGQAVAMDAGVLYWPEWGWVQKRLHLGLCLQNLGTPLSYGGEGDPLPRTLRLGAAYALLSSEITPDSPHDVKILFEGNQGLDTDARLQVGAEYWFKHLVAARVGYQLNQDLKGMTAGLGFQYEVLQGCPVNFDYAFSAVQKFNSLHKVSITYGFYQSNGRLSAIQQEELAAKTQAEAEKQKALAAKQAEEAAAEADRLEAAEQQRQWDELRQLILDTRNELANKPNPETRTRTGSWHATRRGAPGKFSSEEAYRAYIDQRVRQIIAEMGLDKKESEGIFEKIEKYVAAAVKEVFKEK